MPHFAHFDHTQPEPQQILGWYDTDLFQYKNMPAEADLLLIEDTNLWQNRTNNVWAQKAGQLITVDSTVFILPQIKQNKINRLKQQVAAPEIVASSALGSVNYYKTDAVSMNQTMQAAMMVAFNQPASNIVMIYCTPNSDLSNLVHHPHTAAQVRQLMADIYGAQANFQNKLNGLIAQVNNANSADQIKKIDWK